MKLIQIQAYGSKLSTDLTFPVGYSTYAASDITTRLLKPLIMNLKL